MKKVIAQCRKELVQFRRDRLTVALAIVLPALSLFLFGFGVRLELKNIPLAVQNFDNSQISQELVDRLYNNEQFIPSQWHGKHVIDNALNWRRALVGVIIPPDFSRMLKSGRGARIEVFIDATDVNNARVIRNGILGTVNGFLQTNGFAPKHDPVEAELRLWFNPGRKESLYVVPGTFGLLLWIYPSLLSALAMVKEKETGTILQAYASSITAQELILGKMLAYVMVGLGEALAVYALGMIVFSLPFAGDPTPFLLCTVLFISNSVLFGLLIGAATNSQSSAVQGVATVGFTTALLLSGFLYPLRNITYPLSLLSNIVPTRYFVELVRDAFVRGGGWGNDWRFPLIFLAFSLVLFRMATSKLSRMQINA
jgi:ABC-2 type transport system permease protein